MTEKSRLTKNLTPFFFAFCSEDIANITNELKDTLSK
jgi:hypothetical protein